MKEALCIVSFYHILFIVTIRLSVLWLKTELLHIFMLFMIYV